MMPSRSGPALTCLFALAAAVLLAAGCGKRAGSAPQALLRSSDFPLEAVDAQGVRVRVERRPQRIVSSGPVVTEILFAVGAGDRVVAVSDQCNYPPQVQQLSRVGGFFSPSVEKTLAAEPDLVIGSRGNPPDFLSAIRASGCPVFTVDPRTLEDIFTVIQQIARLAGNETNGTKLVSDLKARLAAVGDKVKGVPESRRPTVFIFLQVEPIWTAGADTFQDDVIRAAGARNAAGRLHGFTAFGAESLVAADPDYLLLSTMEGDPEFMVRQVASHPVYRKLYAVRKGHLIVLDADVIMRPGPRIVEAVEAMAKAFYPDRLGGAASSSATSSR